MAKSFCVACQKTFKSEYTFDKHRSGDHAGRTRRCLSTEEMQAKGMLQNERGWWISSAYDHSIVRIGEADDEQQVSA
jgi:hypothetical protein